MLDLSRINEGDLEQHLSRIINSEPFSKSKRLAKLLTYVVWKSFNESPAFIRAYEIAIDAFDRGSEFDPEDPYIRNIAKLTRRALQSYYESPHSEDWIKLELPIGNFIIHFRELNRSKSINSGPTLTHGNKNNITINVSTRLPQDQRANAAHLGTTIDIDSGKPLLGIIPFKQIGSCKSDTLLGDVVAGELIAALSPSTLLNVVSRLSTTQFKNQVENKDLLSNQLNADYVVTGHYQLSAAEIVLTVELSARRQDQMVVLWADTLNSKIQSTFNKDNDLVSTLKHKITTAIERHEIQTVSHCPFETLGIHRLIICSANYMHCGPERLFNKSREILLAALKKNPQHPTVNALLAQWHIFKINRCGGWSSNTDSKHEKKVWQYCEEALNQNSSHALALTTYGLVQTQLARDPEKGMQYYITAEKFNPNEPLVHAYKAAIHAYFDEGKEAVDAAELALKLSPFDPQLHMFQTCLSAAYLAENRLEDAEIHARKAYQLNNNHTSNLRGLISVLVEQGKVSEAKTFAEKLLAIDPAFNTTSYLSQSPNAQFQIGKRIAQSLEKAGVPSH